MKKVQSKFILITVILLVFMVSIDSDAYFKTPDPRPSLLEIRDAERSLRKAEKAVKETEQNFDLVDQQKLRSSMKEIHDIYLQMKEAYQENDDQLTVINAKKIRELSKELELMTVESKPVQFRAFWLDSRTLSQQKNRKDIAEFLDRAKRANFNVIIPEVFFKGLSIIPDNNYFKQDPRFEDWEEDPLQILIEEAHKREIEVHAWVWVFNENTHGKPGRLLTENPEWANINKAGEIVTYHNSTWLSPAREDVKKYLQKRYQYLVGNYNLDGINLDYIRFPEEYRGSFGFDDNTLKLFSEKTGFNVLDIENNSRAQSEWNKFREDLITEMVEETSEILRRENPDILISADVIPGTNEARYRAMQNWKLWLDKGYLDFVLPMTYTTNLFSELRNWVKNDRTAVDSAIYPGISVFKLSQQQMLEQIKEMNQINPNGLSLFAAAHLTEEDYEVLEKGHFKEKALIPYQNDKAAAVVKEMISKRIRLIESSGNISSDTAEEIMDYLEKYDKNYAYNLVDNFLKENNQQAENINPIIKDDLTKHLQKSDSFISENVSKVLVEDFTYLYEILDLY